MLSRETAKGAARTACRRQHLSAALAALAILLVVVSARHANALFGFGKSSFRLKVWVVDINGNHVMGPGIVTINPTKSVEVVKSSVSRGIRDLERRLESSGESLKLSIFNYAWEHGSLEKWLNNYNLMQYVSEDDPLKCVATLVPSGVMVSVVPPAVTAPPPHVTAPQTHVIRTTQPPPPQTHVISTAPPPPQTHTINTAPPPPQTHVISTAPPPPPPQVVVQTIPQYVASAAAPPQPAPPPTAVFQEQLVTETQPTRPEGRRTTTVIEETITTQRGTDFRGEPNVKATGTPPDYNSLGEPTDTVTQALLPEVYYVYKWTNNSDRNPMLCVAPSTLNSLLGMPNHFHPEAGAFQASDFQWVKKKHPRKRQQKKTVVETTVYKTYGSGVRL